MQRGEIASSAMIDAPTPCDTSFSRVVASGTIVDSTSRVAAVCASRAASLPTGARMRTRISLELRRNIHCSLVVVQQLIVLAAIFRDARQDASKVLEHASDVQSV